MKKISIIVIAIILVGLFLTSGGARTDVFLIKLVDSKYIPKLDNKTNTKEILNADVYNKTEDSIVLFYDDEYVLFGKIK